MKKFKLFSYEPPAKGVKKNDDRASVQTDFFGFFIMYGRKFWNLSNLNLLMAVYILIVSFGVWQLSGYPIAFYGFLALAALAFGIVNTGAVYAVRGYVRGDPVYILSDFRYAVKHNWKQGILMGLLDLAVIVLLVFDLFFWSGMDVNRLPVLPETGSDTQITETVPDDAQSETIDTNRENTSPAAADTENPDESDSFDPSVTVTPTAKPRSFMEQVFFYAGVFLIFIDGFMRHFCVSRDQTQSCRTCRNLACLLHQRVYFCLSAVCRLNAAAHHHHLDRFLHRGVCGLSGYQKVHDFAVL